MNKVFLTGATLFGISVFCLLGAFGFGADSLGLLLADIGIPVDYSNKASRAISGALFASGIVLQVVGGSSEKDGRTVSHEEFLAAVEFVERQEKAGR